MKSSINKQRLTNLLKGIQKSIDLFESQGFGDVYFTAQFLRGGKKQNGIERGDLSSFAKQIRTYAFSEDADTVRIEFIDESTSKTIYSKVLTDLRAADGNSEVAVSSGSGLGGFNGLGEVEFNALVDKRVEAKEQAREFTRMSKELEELRGKNAALASEKEELEATLKAKKDTEYYMGIIGAAFPGLAPLFSGTPLAQAANFLAGTSDLNGNALPAAGEQSDDKKSISAMIGEFCDTLTTQEASAVHLLFMAFEKDRALIQRALATITTQMPATA